MLVTKAVAQRSERSPSGFDHRPRHTKDVIYVQMVPYALLLSVQHIRIGLASPSSQTSFKQYDGFDTERAVGSD